MFVQVALEGFESLPEGAPRSAGVRGRDVVVGEVSQGHKRVAGILVVAQHHRDRAGQGSGLAGEDGGEEDHLFFPEVVFEFVFERRKRVGDGGEPVVLVAMDAGDLFRKELQTGEFLVEGAVVLGQNVFDEDVRGLRGPAIEVGGSRGFDFFFDFAHDLVGVDFAFGAGLGQFCPSAAAEVDFVAAKDAGGDGEFGGDVSDGLFCMNHGRFLEKRFSVVRGTLRRVIKRAMIWITGNGFVMGRVWMWR